VSEHQPTAPRRFPVRYGILAMLFVVTITNYADRATISLVGANLQSELGLSAVHLGYIFSAFGWAYVLGQIPGGWLLDRFGSKMIYGAGLLLWSLFTFLQGFVGVFDVRGVLVALFALRFLVGLAEAPSFPGNARIVAAWFPTRERGTASAIFNSAQYFATVLFAPLMGFLVYRFGWPWVFWVMGPLGMALVLVWARVIHAPRSHPAITAGELEELERGGALVDLDSGAKKPKGHGTGLGQVARLLGSRMMLGVYLAQYCINTITYFFLTWFPVYLVKERGMNILEAGLVASVPAIAGFCGGVLGGVVSDALLRRGRSLSFARKAPIVCGLLLSTSMVLCNVVETQWVVVALMALAFFGKGLGALGWAVVSDTSPREMAGLSGGVFNTFGNVAAITTPIVIGYLIESTGSFAAALTFVGINAVVAVLSYLLLVGEIRRLELMVPAGEPSRPGVL
jgi:ACS family glucarate transporter-like MFS transporter